MGYKLRDFYNLIFLSSYFLLIFNTATHSLKKQHDYKHNKPTAQPTDSNLKMANDEWITCTCSFYAVPNLRTVNRPMVLKIH